MGGGAKTRRYEKTEGKILAVFFNNPNCTMRQLAEKAGIAYSTLYTHYSCIQRIIPDCKKNILEKYHSFIGKKIDGEIGLKMLYIDTLVFIIKNRQIFEILLKFNGREVLVEMFFYFKPKLKMPEKAFRILMAEISEIVFEWGEKGFLEDEIEKVLADIMYLTNTCYARLDGLR